MHTQTVSANDMRRKFGDIATGLLQGKNYVVERHGKQIGAMVPMQVYERWKRGREEMFEMIHAMQQQANMSPEEAERIVDEEVRAYRASKKAKKV